VVIGCACTHLAICVVAGSGVALDQTVCACCLASSRVYALVAIVMGQHALTHLLVVESTVAGWSVLS
jgi:hypothetical protein